MRLNEAFPSKYLSAADLNGKEVPVTIENVVQEQMRDGTLKLVVYFEGKKKGLALNKVNANRIAARHGDETDEWAGIPVILYPDITEYQGKPVDCIRVRANAPAAKPAAQRRRAEPEPEPDIDETVEGDPNDIPF